MVFSSFEFLVLFTFVVLLLFFVDQYFKLKVNKVDKKTRIKQTILLIASYVFYGWWDWRFCFLMLALTLIAYISSIKIYEGQNVKFYKALGIVFPLIVLGIFKYFNFFIESFTTLFRIGDISTINIILPVGISFFTFQTLSYVIDVANRKIDPCKSFNKLALYIAFFPQLVAGPIVKASYFLPQLDEDRGVNWMGFHDGIQIFTFGLAKKIVFADTLAVFVDQVFNFPQSFSGLTVLLAIVSYSVQIYFDFSGYSDMAVGLAKILGYDLPKNFDLPYISRNISEFWKRWHISLSSWLQEYLYFPLGGNRKGEVRTYINLLITMILGGLWHGASWTFIIWGALHGGALCIHKVYRKRFSKRSENGLSPIFSIGITYVFVCICWVFFRCATFNQAYEILAQLFMWNNGITHIYTPAIVSIVFLSFATYFAFIKAKNREGYRVGVEGYYPILDLTTVKGMTVLFTAIGLILAFAYTGASPFIYFQF